jgi:pyruvate kinase
VRRTKILATIGPASREAPILEPLIAAGLDAVRLNFSHGTHEGHAEVYARVREISARAGRAVAVLQDLQGPKIRIGLVKGQMPVPTGSRLVITTRRLDGENGVVSTEYEALPRDVKPGDRILLDEGRIDLVVHEITGQDVVCEVLDGGVLSSNKGINVPGGALTAASMTDKDRADVRFGLQLGVDFVALSFVRRASDVEDLRALMIKEGRVVPIVAKIEMRQAIDALDEIVEAADGVMVARGDLAIEATLEMIPAHQKKIIERANRAGKLVITATQMLESMTENSLPTRAEVTDVANAVLDGTDAVMLSGETAVGKYPVEAVRRMASIAETAEETLYRFEQPVRTLPPGAAFGEVLARLAVQGCRDVQAKAVVVFTNSGKTAMSLSDERPRVPVLAFTRSEGTLRRLALYWGVQARAVDGPRTPAELLALGERTVVDQGWARKGDPIVFVLGGQTSPDAANSVRFARIGESG